MHIRFFSRRVIKVEVNCNSFIVAINDNIMDIVEDIVTYFATTCHKQTHYKISMVFKNEHTLILNMASLSFMVIK